VIACVSFAHRVKRQLPFQLGLYRWQFAELISEDAWALALSDAVLVGTTALCVHRYSPPRSIQRP
jgi:hypothetical protein